MARAPKDKREEAKLASADVMNAAIDKINEQHALVLLGDKTMILKLDKGVRMITVSAFYQWFANRQMFVSRATTDDTGNATTKNVRVKLGQAWMESPRRRQYDDVVFNPVDGEIPANHFNLWQGFAYKPLKCDQSKFNLFIEHIRENIANGDKDHFHWIMSWIAQIIQQPGDKLGSSLVLQNKKGTGKTLFAEILAQLFGKHATTIDDPHRLYGHFNSHLVSTIFLVLEEAFWAGDKKAEGRLKHLITGKTQSIEYKGKDTIDVRNYIRALILSDGNWTVPAGLEERRFGVFRGSDAHMQDTKYFAAIVRQIKQPGAMEGLMYYLKNYDISGVDLRNPPKTEALRSQKVLTLDHELSWWYTVLQNGVLPWGCDHVRSCPASRLFDHYVRHAMRQGVPRRSIETQIGVMLRKCMPQGHELKRNHRGKYRSVMRDGVRPVDGSTYEFPPLADCRAAFDREALQPMEWDDKEEWTLGPQPAYDPNEII
jgi:hypothetical protein